MALLWADGFDDYDYDATSSTGGVTGEYETFADTGTGGSNIAIVPSGRRGSGAMQFEGSFGNLSSYAQKSLPSALGEIYAAFAINPGTLSFAGSVISFFSGATLQVKLQINTDGSLTAFRNTTSLGSSAAGLISANVFTHIQIRVVFSDTAGIVQVRLNGATSYAINLSSQDTNNGASNVCDAVRLGASSTGASAAMILDDFVIWDTSGSIMNTWIGDVRVDSYAPSADGDLSQFTTSTGTNHAALVDDASPDATDYVQSANVGDVDLYQFPDMSHTPTNIYGVVVTVAALKDDAGSRSIRLKAKSGGTTADNGADLALSTSRARYKGIFETDPNTSAAWTKTAFNAAQFGVTVTV